MSIRVLVAATFSISIALHGCALKIGRVDPSAEPYVRLFKNEAVKRGVFVDVSPIDVEIVDTFVGQGVDESTVGLCMTDGTVGSGQIKLLRSFWDRADATKRENLMFHELGHCALLLDHKNCAFFGNEIMCPNLLDPNYYKANREALVDGLFNG